MAKGMRSLNAFHLNTLHLNTQSDDNILFNVHASQENAQIKTITTTAIHSRMTMMLNNKEHPHQKHSPPISAILATHSTNMQYV